MHACELVELAAAVSTQAPAFIHGTYRPPSSAIEQYWHGSKRRFAQWSRALDQFSKAPSKADPRWGAARWPMMRAVFEEILTGEILTRVFAAVMCAFDGRHGGNVAEPAARSVFIGHLEARQQVLTLLLRGTGLTTQQAMLLNRLRRRSERWCDMLIGYLASHVNVAEFAVDRERAKEFSEDLSHQKEFSNGSNAWVLVQASMKTAFGRGLGSLAVNGDSNEKIAQGVMGCFAADQFDSIGKLQSLWLVRLRGVADDAQDMLDELAADEQFEASEEARRDCEAHLQRLRNFGCC